MIEQAILKINPKAEFTINDNDINSKIQNENKVYVTISCLQSNQFTW